MRNKKDIYLALVGKPNSGKTALFNALTGARQKVANYPGVTVERKEGLVPLGGGESVRLLDLPGAYSLQATSQDEQITHDMLHGKIAGFDAPDFVLCMADATNMRLSLPLVLEVQALGIPMLLVLNKMDVAHRLGIHISVEALSAELGVPVVPMVATKSHKENTLQEIIKEQIALLPEEKPHELPSYSPVDSVRRLQHILQTVMVSAGKHDRATRVLDSVLLHPLWGMLSFLLIVSLAFQGVFNFAEAPMDAIDGGISWLVEQLHAVLPEGYFRSLVADGVVAGVGSVIIFLPQVLILFFFILVLEDSGYMARAAFLLDRIMGRVGLHGKSFIPLLSSFACAIPGIMATRTIENPRDRIVTILIAPLMTCSARLPVYTLIISAFIPNDPVFGFFRLQGVVLFGLYLAGIVSAMIVAFVMRSVFMRGKRTPLLLEMPDYALPNARNLFLGLYERVKIFISRTGRIILPLMILVWFLSSFPAAPEGATEPDILYSFAGIIGHFMAPLFAPLGFNWQMVVALIPGMAAREVAVAVLGTVYAISAEGDVDSLAAILSAEWSLPTALAFLTWYVFAPQCLPTLGVVKRETNGWRWPLVMLVYLMTMAYTASYVVYRISLSLLG